MSAVEFQVSVSHETAKQFAEISGDWNPLHTDMEYAATTHYKGTILHGAFSAGLVSRMAGMHIPGKNCILHTVRLRFLEPILLPAELIVVGQQVTGNDQNGRVQVAVNDRVSGARYVEAHYDFGHHSSHDATGASVSELIPAADAAVLITGASGGIGDSLMTILGDEAIGVSRGSSTGLLHVPELAEIASQVGDRKLKGIVHCAWPAPDNVPFLELANIEQSIHHHVSKPLEQINALARLLVTNGEPGAPLILVGSAFAEPGRHNFRMPLYSLSKAMIPNVARILALELAPEDRRCYAAVFDVVNGGMNRELSTVSKIAHEDRSPFGRIAQPEEAAEQLVWMLRNGSHLLSGACITVTGGSLP